MRPEYLLQCSCWYSAATVRHTKRPLDTFFARSRLPFDTHPVPTIWHSFCDEDSDSKAAQFASRNKCCATLLYHNKCCVTLLYHNKCCVTLLYHNKCCVTLLYHNKCCVTLLYHNKCCVTLLYHNKYCVTLLYHNKCCVTLLYHNLNVQHVSV
jgi:hypothetical protein